MGFSIDYFHRIPKWCKLLLFTSLLILWNQPGTAQNKYEREFRIKEKEVPEYALQFLEAMHLSRKIKWYKEEGLSEETIEAKTKHRGCKYSIEFDLKGEIEDIEKVIKWKDIPPSTRSKIDHFINENHQKVRKDRIQVQFTGKREDLVQLISNKKIIKALQIKYEIVLKAKTNNKYEDIEYLFSDDGSLEKKAIIISKNTDNLEY